MALGAGVHVVADTDGLFEQAFHTAEVHTAVHQTLHSTETESSEVSSKAAMNVPTLATPAAWDPSLRSFGGRLNF